jgi:hypothetical protein
LIVILSWDANGDEENPAWFTPPLCVPRPGPTAAICKPAVVSRAAVEG